ncbi:MAG: FHA domain-containing protein [Anaerolineae bacterium]|nr:FHA domain-containing protein [Anaerolineae bacterium]
MTRLVITISSDLFDQPEQEASVRENLLVRTLIEETLKEFNLPQDALYTLRIESNGRLLDPEKTLEQQGVKTGERLLFSRERRAPRREVILGNNASRIMFSTSKRPFFREDSRGEIFNIDFQPAIIGRPDHSNPASRELLAVNLEGYEGAKSVSRYHARVTESQGQFYIESLAEHNPVYLNGAMVRLGEKRVMYPGDKVRVGQITLTFGIRQSATQYISNAPQAS